MFAKKVDTIIIAMFSAFLNKILKLNLYPYQVLTYILISTVFGIYAAGVCGLDWQAVQMLWPFVASLLLFAAFINYILKTRILVLISWLLLFFLAGAVLYSWQKAAYFPKIDIQDETLTTSGEIINDPYLSYKNQEIIVKTIHNGQSFLLLAKVPRYPKFSVGDSVKITGKLQKPGTIEDFDYERYLRGKRVAYTMLMPENAEKIESMKSLKYQALRYLYQFKHSFEESLNQNLHEPYSSLAAGIITGAKRSMPDNLANDLSAAGLTHIVALSGFNITIIIVAISAALSSFLSRKKIFALGALLVFAFIIMTGASSSVVRAGFFSLLILFGKTLGRKAYQVNVLLITAVVMLTFNPFILTDDMSFQLSFLAFCGIIYLSPIISRSVEKSFLKSLPSYIKAPLSETLSAQIMVLPLISFAFGKISLIAPISNVLVLWIIPLAMLLAFITGFAAIMVAPIGTFFAYITWPVLYYIIAISKISAKLPLAMLEVKKSSYLISILFYSLIFIYWRSQQKRIVGEKEIS